MSNSRNAFHRWLCEDNRGMTKTINIPAAVIKEAGFNTKNPIFVQYHEKNHFGLTQNGSYDGIIRTINGWTRPDGIKTYRLGVQKLVNWDCDSVFFIPDKDNNYVNVFGVAFI